MMSRGRRRPQQPAAASPADGAGDSGLRGPGRSRIDSTAVADAASALEQTRGYQRLTGRGLTDDELAARDAHDTRAALSKLTNEQINRAVVRAGGAARSDRTLRRWRQRGQIPDIARADDADGKPGRSARELIRRQAYIAELGGTASAAQKLGRSASSVRRWQSGQSDDFSKGAKQVMDRHQAVSDGLRHATAPPPRPPAKRAKGKRSYGTAPEPDSGASGAAPSPRVVIHGRIDYEGDGVEYQRSNPTLNLSTVGWPPADVEELIVAVQGDDHATVIELAERAATERWANRADGSRYEHYYDDHNGFRIKQIDSMEFYFD